MKYFLIVLISILFLISLNAQTSKILEKQFKSGSDLSYVVQDYSKDDLLVASDYLSGYLKSKGYQKPDYDFFCKKIKEIFDINLDDYSSDELLMGTKTGLEDGTDASMYIVSKKDCFIYQQGQFYDSSNPNKTFLYLNSYLFNNDKAAFRYLTNTKDGELFYLISQYGYLNDDLENFLFPILDNDAKKNDFKFFSFLFFGRKGAFGKWQLRKDLFNKYMNHNINSLDKIENYKNQNTFLESTELENYVEIVQYSKNYEGNRDENTAFLLNWMVKAANVTFRQFNGEVYNDMPIGEIITIYDIDISIKDRLEMHNYYEYILIKEYSATYIPSYENENGKGEITGKKIYGVINDPDGYVNVRENRTTKSQIITTLKSGTKVQILSYKENLNKISDWWYIQIPGKKERGFVHMSRINSTINKK